MTMRELAMSNTALYRDLQLTERAKDLQYSTLSQVGVLEARRQTAKSNLLNIVKNEFRQRQ
jgi:hypothetical protein